MTEKELVEIKEQIESFKTEIAKLQGRKSSLMETLLNDHGFKTIGQAKKHLSTLEQEIETVGDEIQDMLAEIEKQYNEQD